MRTLGWIFVILGLLATPTDGGLIARGIVLLLLSKRK